MIKLGRLFEIAREVWHQKKCLLKTRSFPKSEKHLFISSASDGRTCALGFSSSLFLELSVGMNIIASLFYSKNMEVWVLKLLITHR